MLMMFLLLRFSAVSRAVRPVWKKRERVGILSQREAKEINNQPPLHPSSNATPLTAAVADEDLGARRQQGPHHRLVLPLAGQHQRRRPLHRLAVNVGACTRNGDLCGKMGMGEKKG